MSLALIDKQFLLGYSKKNKDEKDNNVVLPLAGELFLVFNQDFSKRR
jgi:hypothetical protein